MALDRLFGSLELLDLVDFDVERHACAQLFEFDAVHSQSIGDATFVDRQKVSQRALDFPHWLEAAEVFHFVIFRARRWIVER